MASDLNAVAQAILLNPSRAAKGMIRDNVVSDERESILDALELATPGARQEFLVTLATAKPDYTAATGGGYINELYGRAHTSIWKERNLQREAIRA